MAKKTSSKQVKPKKGAWFVPIRGSYLPCSIEGWLTYIPFILYIVVTFYVAFGETTSEGLAILYIIPNLVAITIIMSYIASKKS